jgi:hypothetical protein
MNFSCDKDFKGGVVHTNCRLKHELIVHELARNATASDAKCL